MTTELEQEFYGIFGIEKQLEPKALCQINKLATCEHCIYYDNGKCKSKQHYPEITDRILLELICVLGTIHLNIILKGKTIKEIKEFVLNECIIYESFIGQQVKALFERMTK